MRDYIFHGKRVDNGEWVEGSLLIDPDLEQYFIFGFDYYTADYALQREEFTYQVIPESVGQYTGMKDKNGRKIFEGDLVRCQERFDRPYSDKRKSKRHIGVVKYQVRGSHFDYAAEWIVEVKDYGKFVHGAWGDFYDCEVIGTVFENADLLEG